MRIHLIEDQTTDGTLDYLKFIRKRDGDEYKSFILDSAIDLPMYSGMKLHPTMRWTYRVNEWLGWHDKIWFPYAVDGRADHVSIIHSDVVCHPETLSRCLEIINDHGDAGWIGSIGMGRDGKRIVAWVWIVESPYEEYRQCVEGGDGTTPKWKPLVRVLNYGEEGSRPQVFQCAFSGSCYTLRGKILKKGVSMRAWAQEAAIPFAVEMGEKGYVSYCDKLTPFTHMNYDGIEVPYIPL
jgi:hypothetical protein